MINKEKLKGLLMANLTRDLYKAHSKNLSAANLRLTRLLSVAGLLLGLGLALASRNVASLQSVFPLYLFLCISMIPIILLSHRKTSADTHRGTPLLYFFVCVVYLFSLLLGGIVQASSNAVMFCVFLVILPTLVGDYFLRVIFPGIIMEILFLYFASHYTEPRIFQIDVTNSISCLILGIILAYSRTKTRAREFTLRDTLRDQRDTDALTQLSTRSAAETQIRKTLERGSIPCAMALIDVDNFKSINDTYGHNAGDRVLAGVASIIRNTFRSSDLVCRLGGDEFLVFAYNMSDEDIIRQRATAISQALDSDVFLNESSASVTVSIGIVLTPKHGNEFNELYRKADSAMYEAKRAGKNNYAIFGEPSKAPAGSSVERRAL